MPKLRISLVCLAGGCTVMRLASTVPPPTKKIFPLGLATVAL